MKVLHDWDNLLISNGWAKKRGISLFCYGLANKLSFLKKIKWFSKNTEKIKREKIEYMEVLIKLDHLCGVKSIFGIRDEIRKEYNREINELTEKYDIDVRRHIHIGDQPDPNRIRLWEPPLKQSKESWSFDTKWAKGEKVILKADELPIFHVDCPHHLAYYIDYLYDELARIKKDEPKK